MDIIERQNLPTLVEQITLRAQDEWDYARHGHPIGAPQPTEPWQRLSQHEHEHDPTATQNTEDNSSCTKNKPQHLLCQLFDNIEALIMHMTLEEHEARDDIERLAELRHPHVDHQWLYHIDPSAGTVLPPGVYQDALCHRLGCRFIPETTTCHCCNKHLGAQCIHAGCCAAAEATQGHYAVSRTLFALKGRPDHHK